MKNNIYFLLILFMHFGMSASLSAQDVLVESEYVEKTFEMVDLSDNFLDLEIKTAVTNNTSEVIELKWTRIEVYNGTQDEWESQICDNNLCYGYNTSTNFNSDVGLEEPFTLQPGETFDAFALHVWPRMTSGCGQYKVLFSRTNAPEEVLAVIHYNVSVNTENCAFLSSTQEQLIGGITLFPNPVTDQFTLSSTQMVKGLTVYNLLGRAVRTFNYQDGEYFDISDLADGLYLVGLQDADGRMLKTLRVSKRGLRP